jgi:Flp pilus assembly protein TadD
LNQKLPRQVDETRAVAVALGHHRAGRFSEAEKIYREVLAGQPRNTDALHLLGVLLGQGGQPELAVDYIGRAIALRPDVADYHANLGEFLRALGQLDQSAASFRRAIAIKEDHAWFHNGLGVALAEARRIDDAIAEFRHAVELKGDDAEARNNLAGALLDAGRPVESMAEAGTAIGLEPRMHQAYNHLGRACADQGQFREAIHAYSQAISLKPNYAKAHANLALVYLLLGDYPRGWAEYEWRTQVPGIVGRRRFDRPRWNGQDLSGRTILLYPEQGFGDMIQFARFIPQLTAGGARVILEAPAELARTFRGVAQIAPEGQPPPPYDVHCPLLSLGAALGVTAQTIPASIPYLTAEPEWVAAWANRFDPNDRRLRVGLVWAGRRTHSNERNRSMTLAQLAGLGSVAEVAFYSLQKGDGATEAASPPAGLKLIDWTSELKDFADTAGLMANLDLIVSVDTSAAHLAGALGKKVWLMLPCVPDWRWGLEREDSPWYPTVRLFRQKSAGQWGEVLDRVRAELAGAASSMRRIDAP